jgi:hypothetical protein
MKMMKKTIVKFMGLVCPHLHMLLSSFALKGDASFLSPHGVYGAHCLPTIPILFFSSETTGPIRMILRTTLYTGMGGDMHKKYFFLRLYHD